MTAASRWATVLAVSATATALCLSVLAGWQRGGTWPERVVWIAIGMVLVTSAHLLPALMRDSPRVARGVGSVLWFACMATACYGHVTFFLLAQQHAGDRRVATVTVVRPAPARSLTVVMTERATVTQQLAWADARRCPRDCTGLQARRTTLAAKLDALNAEADDLRRIDTEHDQATARRDALRADPVTSRLAALLGTTTIRVDLLSGLVFAAVLECIGCLLWAVALWSPPFPATAAVVTDSTLATLTPPRETIGDAANTTSPDVTSVANVIAVTRPAVTAVATSHADRSVSSKAVPESRVVMPTSHTPRDDPLTPSPGIGTADDDVTRLAQDVAAGQVRPTVADIRRHLGCSQARATALRRQLIEHTTTT